MLDSWLNAGHRLFWTFQADTLQPALSKIALKNTGYSLKNNLMVRENELSLLKGCSSFIWQVFEGKNQTPVTLIEAVDKVDSDMIFAQEKISF